MGVEVRVRRLGADEALLAAALHLQSLHAAGVRAEPGQLDRYAEAWSTGGDALPQWVAEAADAHCGTLLLRAPVPLPLPPGIDVTPGTAQVVLLYVVDPAPGGRSAPTRAQVQTGLLRTARAWAAQHGVSALDLPGDLGVVPDVLSALFAVGADPGHRVTW